MSNPHHKPYSKTVFVVEGVKTAAVVTTIGTRMTGKRMKFHTPEAALTWCRRQGARMVYSPAELPADN